MPVTVSSGTTTVATHTIVNYVVESSGTLDVADGGKTFGLVTVDNGGQVFVEAGGAITDTIIDTGGNVTVSGGGTANSTTVLTGGSDLIEGGTVLSTTIEGGSVTVGDNGVAVHTVISGGSQILGDGEGGGTATNTTIDSGGDQYVGDAREQPQFNSTGDVTAPYGGLAISTTIESGGTQHVGYFLGYGVARNTIIDGGTQIIGEAGAGAAINTLIENGGKQIVGFEGNGTANNTTIEDGGIQDVGYLGGFGSATNTIVEGGGVQLLGFGGTGAATDTTVQNGGLLDVKNGTATDTTVEGGGSALVESGGTLNGVVTLENGGTVALEAGAITNAASFDLVGTGNTLDIGGTTMPSSPISGFVNGDTIDLLSVANSGGSADMDYSDNVLTITIDSASYELNFDPGQDFNGDFFHLNSAGGGTEISESTTPCFCRGTLILTERGEVPVEALSIGDTVSTRSGEQRRIKWIGRRSYAGRFVTGRKHALPICIKAGALADGTPRRDLWISPHHAMYFKGIRCEGVLIEARELVNGVSIVQPNHIQDVTYFHVELDSHDVVIAEGALSESFVDDNSRSLFHNAQDYRTLYPDDGAAASYCAPRITEGDEIEAVRERITQRAGMRLRNDAQMAGALRGSVEKVEPKRIVGWALSTDHPEVPVCLDIYVAGRHIGQSLANRYREDLKRAGLGSGRHSFVFALPEGLDVTADKVEVRRSFDGAMLRLATGISASIGHAA